MITLWKDMLEQEKVIWLNSKLLHEELEIGDPLRIDHNFVARCELSLNDKQRALYIKYLSSDVAVQTYNGLSDEEQLLPETTDKFYFNFLTLSPDLRAERIWNILAEYAP